MPRTRYVKTAEQVEALLEAQARPAFLDSRSLSATFLTDPAVVAELLPPPLEPAAEPRVSVGVYVTGRSNCVGPFNGSSVNLACRYRGEDGLYCLTMPMSTDTAITFGRELYAEPKKAAEIRLEREDRRVRGTVTRHGVTYIELGGYLDEDLQEVDLTTSSKHYYFRYFPAADGSGLAADPELICVSHTGRVHRLARCEPTVTFRESRHDPVIDVPVVSVEGGAFSEGETHTRAEVAATVPAADFLPYAFAKMDDLTAWAGAEPGGTVQPRRAGGG